MEDRNKFGRDFFENRLNRIKDSEKKKEDKAQYGREDRKTALAQFLGLDIKSDEFGYLAEGYRPEMIEYGKESYFVLTDDEADNEFKEQQEQMWDDTGLDSYTPSFKEWILKDAIDLKKLHRDAGSDYENMLYEDIENDIRGFTSDMEGTKIEDRVREILKEEMKLCWERQSDLSGAAEEIVGEIGIDENDYDNINEYHKEVMKGIDDLGIEDMIDSFLNISESLYLIIDDLVELIMEDWDVLDWVQGLYDGEELSIYLSSYIDLDKVFEEVEKQDGRGHSLALVDGEENEEKVDGETFYIYRMDAQEKEGKRIDSKCMVEGVVIKDKKLRDGRDEFLIYVVYEGTPEPEVIGKSDRFGDVESKAKHEARQSYTEDVWVEDNKGMMWIYKKKGEILQRPEKIRTDSSDSEKDGKKEDREADLEYLKFMSEEEQRRAYDLFLELGNKDTFEGFLRQFDNDMFNPKTGSMLEYGGEYGSPEKAWEPLRRSRRGSLLGKKQEDRITHGFGVGDRVRIAKGGLLTHSRATPASMGYTQSTIDWRGKLHEHEKRGDIGIISQVFDTNVDVDFEGNVIHVPAYMIELVDSKKQEGEKVEDWLGPTGYALLQDVVEWLKTGRYRDREISDEELIRIIEREF